MSDEDQHVAASGIGIASGMKPYGFVSLWSSQRNPVVDKLLRGITHVQARVDSAAYDRTLHPTLWRGHRRAYAFIVSEYQKRRASKMSHAPSWFSFTNSYDFARHVHTGRLAIERIIEVSVPRSALFVFRHGPNWDKMLSSFCLKEDLPRFARPETCQCSWRQRLRSWQNIFAAENADLDGLQAITDHIEPNWLRRVLWLDVQDGAFIDRAENALTLMSEIAKGPDPFANQATLPQVNAITSAAFDVWMADKRAQDARALETWSDEYE